MDAHLLVQLVLHQQDVVHVNLDIILQAAAAYLVLQIVLYAQPLQLALLVQMVIFYPRQAALSAHLIVIYALILLFALLAILTTLSMEDCALLALYLAQLVNLRIYVHLVRQDIILIANLVQLA